MLIWIQSIVKRDKLVKGKVKEKIIGYRIYDTEAGRAEWVSKKGYDELNRRGVEVVVREKIENNSIDIEDIKTAYSKCGYVNKWDILIGISEAGLPVVLDMQGRLAEMQDDTEKTSRSIMKYKKDASESRVVYIADGKVFKEEAAISYINRNKLVGNSLNLDTLGVWREKIGVRREDGAYNEVPFYIREIKGSIGVSGNKVSGLSYIERQGVYLHGKHEEVVIEDCNVLDRHILVDCGVVKGSVTKDGIVNPCSGGLYEDGLNILRIRNVKKMQIEVANFKIKKMILDNVGEILDGDMPENRQIKGIEEIEIANCENRVIRKIEEHIEKFKMDTKLSIQI